MSGKNGLIVKLHNRRVAGCIDNKGGEDGYHFMFKRLMPDGTVGVKTLKLSCEAVEAMAAIVNGLNERKDA